MTGAANAGGIDECASRLPRRWSSEATSTASPQSVNRAPIAGRVVLKQRHGGPFHSLRKRESVFENERVTISSSKEGIRSCGRSHRVATR